VTDYTILGSGSSGNAILVGGSRPWLIDAGLRAPLLEAHVRACGQDPARLAGMVLTHEHADHARGAPRLATDFKIPVYGTAGTLAALPDGDYDRRPLEYDDPTQVADATLELFPVLHDSAQAAGVRFTRDGRTLAYLTDAGQVTPRVVRSLRDAHHLLVESNHDPDLLRSGPYPDMLKRRIRGGHGHLSNDACGELLSQVVTSDVRNVVLHHLSRMNNTPELALATNHAILHRRGLRPLSLVAAPAYGPFGPFEL